MKFDVEKWKEKAKETLKSIHPGSREACMRICMMGARGVGKTSVLTSMFMDLNKVTENNNLQLLTATDPDSGINMTENDLMCKLEELKGMFDSVNGEGFVVNGGIAANAEVRTYDFKFGLKGKSSCIYMQVKDFPGEYVEREPQIVEDFIRESNVVLIAIDTPHLMECDGRYNEIKNRMEEITKFFKKIFADLQEDKLILFVPLKCEKYYREKRMDEVCAAVESAYGELIDFLGKGGLKSRTACAVTPILTVGTVEFKKFETDENGDVLLLKNKPIPAKVRYGLVSPNASYSPKYCEQPLCYLLSFIVRLYKRNQSVNNDSGFLKKLGALFKLFPDDPTLLLEVSKVARKKITDRDGYKIIQGESMM